MAYRCVPAYTDSEENVFRRGDFEPRGKRYYPKGMKKHRYKRCAKLMTLSELKKGQCARVSHMNVNGNMRRRLQDIGLVNGAEIKCVGVSPLGDPSAYLIKGAMIAIRNKEAERIGVELSV